MTADLMPAKRRGGAQVSDKRRCGAKTRGGGVCTQFPVEGTDRCKMHGGMSPQVRAKARERALHVRLNRELEVRGWEPVTNPAAELADLAGETLAFKDLARERINELDEWEREVSGENFDGLEIHAAVKIYMWALEQSEKILGRMSSLGLSAEILREALDVERERPTREQVEKLAAVLNRILSDSRVSVSGDAQSVVVDAMKAEGLG